MLMMLMVNLTMMVLKVVMLRRRHGGCALCALSLPTGRSSDHESAFAFAAVPVEKTHRYEKKAFCDDFVADDVEAGRQSHRKMRFFHVFFRIRGRST